MGRELRRKEEKKNKNKVANKQEELDTSIKGTTIVKVVVFVLLLLLILWYILAVFVTKEIDISGNKENNNDVADTSSVSNRILASQTFEQSEEVYYVYYYDFNDEDENISSTINSKNDMKIYKVDTSSSLNQNYVTEEKGNNSVTGINDLKVKNQTLLEITNDKVTGYYEGSINIINFLNK